MYVNDGSLVNLTSPLFTTKHRIPILIMLAVLLFCKLTDCYRRLLSPLYNQCPYILIFLHPPDFSFLEGSDKLSQHQPSTGSK